MLYWFAGISDAVCTLIVPEGTAHLSAAATEERFRLRMNAVAVKKRL